MALNDIYQLKDSYTFLGQTMENVYYYQDTTGGGTAADLLTAWLTDVLSVIRALQSTGVTHTRLQCVNGMDNDDQSVLDISSAGTFAGTTGAPDWAFALRRRTGGLGYRYSYKRYGGVSTAHITTAGALTATAINLVDAVAVAIGELVDGVAGDYRPVQITGGFVFGTAPTFKQDLLGDWQLNSIISHQETRQVYTWINATP